MPDQVRHDGLTDFRQIRAEGLWLVADRTIDNRNRCWDG